MSAKPPTPARARPLAPHPPPREPPGTGSQRILSCVLCQRRKVRCDRQFPCANCVKQQMQCLPATRTLRRKRRFPERELLDRLRSHEELLRRHNIEFEPLHKESPLVGREAQEEGSESEEEQPPAGAADGSSVSASVKSENVFETKSFWRAMTQEAQGSTNESGSPFSDDLEYTVKKAWCQTARDDHILFGSPTPAVDLSTFHPGPVDIFRLWQIYLDNVNPLLKVTHTPSLQVRIIEAASDVSNIGSALEALMFSIYCVATVSLDEDDCRATFGSSKDDLLTKYQFGCQQALANAGFLRSADRECLTALYLYLLSFHFLANPRSLCTMFGLAVRIAQCIGINRESSLARCSVFEAEMRRRLWWSLMLYDTRRGEMADHKDSSLAPTWDCRVPLNVNDADLRPEMKEMPADRGTTTEAFFVLVRSKIADFFRHTSSYLEFTNPMLKPITKELPEGGSIAALERRIERDYLGFCDPENPVHKMTIWHARSYLARGQLLEHYAKFSSRDGYPADAQLDAALNLTTRMIRCDTELAVSPHIKGYRWFLRSYFPFPAYVHIIHDLRRRPRSKLADHAWEVMGDNYDARMPSAERILSPIFTMFSRLILSAWEASEAVSELRGPVAPPRIVLEVKQKLADMKQTAQSTDTEEPSRVANAGTDDSLMAIPMGFGDDGFAYGVGGQDNFEATGAMEQPNIPGLDPFQFMSNQFNWPPMDWGPG